MSAILISNMDNKYAWVQDVFGINLPDVNNDTCILSNRLFPGLD